MAAAHEEVRESHRERVDRLLAGMDQRVATLEDEVASLHRVLDARTAQRESSRPLFSHSLKSIPRLPALGPDRRAQVRTY